MLRREAPTTSVALVLVAYHADRWIGPCLDSLHLACDYGRQLILVDNGGNSRLESYSALSNIEILTTPSNLGFAEANNYALVHGNILAEAVCFLNQDTLSRSGWLEACLACLQEDPAVGAVMPMIENYEATDWDAAFRTCCKAEPRLWARVQEGVNAGFDDFPPFVAVPEITAAAMMVRRDALLKAGPFDPIYGSYYEDYDLCRRIAAAGYKVGICTRGRVGHFGGSVTTSGRAYRRRARWIARNRVIYAARWKWRNRPLGLSHYMFLSFPRNLARSALGRSRVPFSAFVAAHKDLVPLMPRLVSANLDRVAWRRYLNKLAWPTAV